MSHTLLSVILPSLDIKHTTLDQFEKESKLMYAQTFEGYQVHDERNAI